MAYEPLDLLDGDNLTSDHIRHIEEGILQVQEDAETMKESLVKILGDKDIAASTDESMSDIVKKFTYLKNPDVKEYEYSEDIIDIRETVESGCIQMVIIDNYATTAFYVNSTNGFIVDWGDGKTNTYKASSTLNINASHTYTKGSGAYYDGSSTQYVVTIYPDVDSEITRFRSHSTKESSSQANTVLAFAARDVYFKDSLEYMFGFMQKLKYIDLFGGSLGTSDIDVSMKGLCYRCSSLERISGNVCWNAITNMIDVFRGCKNLKDIDLGDVWDTINCTEMITAFFECSLIERIPYFKTNSVITMQQAFQDCDMLIEVAGEAWDLTNCKVMNNLFYSCNSLKKIPCLMNTGNITNVENAFYECSSLVKLHKNQLTLDFSSATSAKGLFNGCSSLEELPVLDLTSAVNVSQLCNNCSSLYIVQEVFNLPNVVGAIDAGYYYSSTPSNMQGIEFMFCGCSSLTNAPEIYAPKTVTCRGLFMGCSNLVNVPTAYSFPECISATSMFMNCMLLTTAPQILDIPKTRSLNYLFHGCTSLKIAPSPNEEDTFEFPEVIQAIDIFNGCASLQTSPVELKLPKATKINSIFSGCTSMTKAPKVMEFGAATSITDMFYNCSALQIPPNRISAPLATTAERLFNGCSSLIVCPELDLPLCTKFQQCFKDCKALTSTIPYHFPKANNIQYFYYGCNGLTFIEEIKSDATALAADYFALNCNGLISIAVPICTNGHVTWGGVAGTCLFDSQSANALKTITNPLDVFSNSFTTSLFASAYLEGTITLSGLKNVFTLNNKPYLTGFRLENPQTNMANITITNCALDADALNQLFEDLPKVTSTRTITIKGNPGAETCDRSIANAKNWTVVYI